MAALGKGLAGTRVFGSVVAGVFAVVVPSAVSAHALFVKPVPRTTSDQMMSLKVAPCGAAPDGVPKVKGQPVEQYQPGAMITVDFKETVSHQGCYLFQLSPTGDNGPWQTLKQVADPAGVGGNQSTQLQLPAGVTCQNCTLRMIQVMLGANCAATQDPTATSNYYSCADVRIGNFADAGIVMDAGAPDYDAATQSDEPASSSGSTTTPTPDGGNVKDEDDGSGAAPGSRNLQAGKGDDCNAGFGATDATSVSFFVTAGLAAMAMLRRRKKS